MYKGRTCTSLEILPGINIKISLPTCIHVGTSRGAEVGFNPKPEKGALYIHRLVRLCFCAKPPFDGANMYLEDKDLLRLYFRKKERRGNIGKSPIHSTYTGTPYIRNDRNVTTCTMYK